MMKGLDSASASELVHLIQGSPDVYDDLIKAAYLKATSLGNMEGTKLRGYGFGFNLEERAADNKLQDKAKNFFTDYINEE